MRDLCAGSVGREYKMVKYCVICKFRVKIGDQLSFHSKEIIISLTEPIQHAEGPFYDGDNDMLYYVDTFTATAHRYNLMTTKSESYKLKGRNSIGFIIPVEGDNDEFVVGADRYIYKLEWPICENVQPILSEVMMIENKKPLNQFNDAKVDSKGRLWGGTLTRNENLSVSAKGGSLYMFDDKSKSYKRKVPDTSISNGIAWSSDHRTMYFVDSQPRLVYSYDFDRKTGDIDNQKVVLDLNDIPELKGIPDGMTIDSDDNLWIALFGGHAVINYDPRTSTVIKVLKMPATYITSVAFGGENLDILFVTSSRLHLSEEEVKKEPLAGSVFQVTNLEVTGVEAFKFMGGLTC